MLFEDDRAKQNLCVTCVGDQSVKCQQAFMTFLGGLFHFDKNISTYSLNPDDWPAKPLYAVDANEPYLNDVFWWVLLEVPIWQNMADLKVVSADELEELLREEYPAVEARVLTGIHSSAAPACRKISRHFIAYLETLLTLIPFWRCGESRAAKIAEAQFVARLKDLETISDEEFSEYLLRKGKKWCDEYLAVGATGGDEAPAASGAGPASDLPGPTGVKRSLN